MGWSTAQKYVQNPLVPWVYFFWLLRKLFLSNLFLLFWWAIRIWGFYIQTSHRGWSTAQKYVQNPLVPRSTSFAAKETFFVQSVPSILMSNKYLSFFIQTSHRGWYTAQKYVQNPLVPRSTSFAAKETFFVQSVPSILMSNKNLRFFSFKHQIGVVNSTKICAKSSGP